MSLKAYRTKRDFSRTPEPAGKAKAKAPRKAKRGKGLSFVVQKHAARRLHYDFRLEVDGVLKSWAVPKGPALDPNVKSLAVEVEDHPLEYGSFEGVIPRGEYGGGSVMIWDQGSWAPEEDPKKALAKGKLSFLLHGQKLRGRFTLVRLRGRPEDDGRNNWLLMKADDEFARPLSEFNVLEAAPDSVSSGRTMEEIAAQKDRVWSSRNKGEQSAERAKPASKRRTKVTLDVASLPGAVKRGLPARFSPQLATLVKAPPAGDGWLHEFKLDGYRLLCRIERGSAKLLTRRGNDWTHRFPTIAEAVAALGLRETLLDGEVVVQRPDGTDDFQALQNAMQGVRAGRLAYFVFDAPFALGYDLTACRQLDRKLALESLLTKRPKSSPLQFSDHVIGHGREALAHAAAHRLEGIVSKRIDAPYEQRRGHNWLKVKCVRSQEFVIGGWTDPAGSRTGLGALLLGYYRDAELVYCGRVGTGFDDRTLAQLQGRLKNHAAAKAPFVNPPKGAAAKGVHWLKPDLVAEVVYGSWTSDGMLRHCSFKGLREDKNPRDVVRDEPIAATAAKRSRASLKTGR